MERLPVITYGVINL